MRTGSVKGNLLNFLSLSMVQIGNYVLPMITLPIISRIIGPEKYGAINYAFAFVGYFVMLVNAGFDLYGARQVALYKENKEKINELFSRIILAKLYICIAATVIFSFCLFTIDELRSEKLIALFTYLLCIGWIINPSWLYNSMQESRRYAVFSFASKLIFSVLVVVMIKERSDYIYHPLITSLAHILVSGISLVYAMRKYKLSIKLVPTKDVLQTINQNKSLSIIWWITNQASSTGIVIVGLLLTTINVGYYSAALRMIIIIQSIVSMPLNTVLFPYSGEAFAKSYEEGMSRFNKTLPYLFALAAGMTVGTFVLAKPVISLFFGNEFKESIIILKILAVALFFSTINSAFGQQVMLNLKKDNVQTKIIVSSFILNIICLTWFTNVYGLIGASIAWPLVEVLTFITYILYFRKNNIKVINANYYTPAYMVGNLLKISRYSSLKQKAAVE